MGQLYRCLLVDLDNTILDFDRAEETAFEAAFSASGLVFTKDIYARYHRINDGLWKMLERGEIERERLKVRRFEMLFEELGIPDRDGRSETLSAGYFRLLEQQAFLYPGAMEVVETLAKSYILAAVTNGSASVQRSRFAACGLAPYFSALVISEEVGAQKPSPLMFERALHVVGDIPKSAACVVGDSLTSDIAGAAAAGIDAIWLDNGGTRDPRGLPVRAIIRDFRELPACLLSVTEDI